MLPSPLQFVPPRAFVTLVVLALQWGCDGGADAPVRLPDEKPSAAVRPRAVRYGAPVPVSGTETRIVLVARGEATRRGRFMDSYESASYDRERGPLVNVAFLDGEEASTGRLLLDRPALIRGVDYPKPPSAGDSLSDSLRSWIAYEIAFGDTNGDGVLDDDDRWELYLSGLDGRGLHRVLPAGARVVSRETLHAGRTLLILTLEGPAEGGKEEEMPQRAFLYDVGTRSLRPYAALDSLAGRAALVVGK